MGLIGLAGCLMSAWKICRYLNDRASSPQDNFPTHVTPQVLLPTYIVTSTASSNRFFFAVRQSNIHTVYDLGIDSIEERLLEK